MSDCRQVEVSVGGNMCFGYFFFVAVYEFLSQVQNDKVQSSAETHCLGAMRTVLQNGVKQTTHSSTSAKPKKSVLIFSEEGGKDAQPCLHQWS